MDCTAEDLKAAVRDDLPFGGHTLLALYIYWYWLLFKKDLGKQYE